MLCAILYSHIHEVFPNHPWLMFTVLLTAHMMTKHWSNICKIRRQIQIQIYNNCTPSCHKVSAPSEFRAQTCFLQWQIFEHFHSPVSKLFVRFSHNDVGLYGQSLGREDQTEDRRTHPLEQTWKRGRKSYWARTLSTYSTSDIPHTR